MLAILGVLTIAVMMTLIMTKRVYTMVALIVVPVVAAVIIQLMHRMPPKQNLGSLITTGLMNIAPTGVMFIFGVLFFGILQDAGAFDPIIARVIKLIGKDPIKICIGTIILTACVHLDGNGAVTFLIAIPALLPIYEAVGMRRSTLATLVGLAAGTMNMVPWGGPTLRAISALNGSVATIYTPLVIPHICGLAFLILVAVILGRRERKYLAAGPGATSVDLGDVPGTSAEAEAEDGLKRPQLFWFNVIMIVITLAVMISNTLPPAPSFMIAFCITLVVNYPHIAEQRRRIDAHAKEALLMAGMLFAAGVFIGIMGGTGMLKAMASALAGVIPKGLGPFLPALVGVVAMPLSLVFDPDSYYFGVMPVIAQAAHTMGVDPAMIGRASILGQMTVGFPVSPLTGSTFLLIGLTGVDLGDHQKKTIPWAFATTLVMLAVAILVRAISI